MAMLSCGYNRQKFTSASFARSTVVDTGYELVTLLLYQLLRDRGLLKHHHPLTPVRSVARRAGRTGVPELA